MKSPKNTTTKCPYCGSEYHHNTIGPQMIIYQIINPNWSPMLITKLHDPRQELQCEYCGAPFKLNVEIQ